MSILACAGVGYPMLECRRCRLWKISMYAKIASLVSRRVRTVVRCTISVFSELKSAPSGRSAPSNGPPDHLIRCADQFDLEAIPLGTHPLPGRACLHAREGKPRCDEVRAVSCSCCRHIPRPCPLPEWGCGQSGPTRGVGCGSPFIARQAICEIAERVQRV
jgi:hypothetical protein